MLTLWPYAVVCAMVAAAIRLHGEWPNASAQKAMVFGWREPGTYSWGSLARGRNQPARNRLLAACSISALSQSTACSRQTVLPARAPLSVTLFLTHAACIVWRLCV